MCRPSSADLWQREGQGAAQAPPPKILPQKYREILRQWSGQHLLRKISLLMRYWSMGFLQVTLQFALLALIISSAVFLYVAADIATNENCEDQLRHFVATSCNRSCSRPCGENGSKVTISSRGNEKEYNVSCVMSNHTTWREITWGKTESWESVLLKHCVREKQCKHIKDESGITRLEVIFKCYGPHCSVSRRSKNGSTLRLQCNPNEDKCQCLIHAGNDTNSCKNGSIKPKVSEEEGNDRKVERHTSTTLCLVVLCLLLEILVWVVLNLWLRKRNRRSVTLDNENATSNPSYQRGLQLLPVSNSPQIHDTGQENYRPPYQPLVMNTRAPGLSVEYLDLTETRDGNRGGNLVVDLASYQDLLQNKTPGGVCREYMIPEEQENLSHDDLNAGEYEKTGDNKKDAPIYYVLEEGDPTEENPRRPFQPPNSSSSHREPSYYVLRELRSRNAINQLNRLPSREENDTGQENYQPPYQPLVMNTRAPGFSVQYLDLTETRDGNRGGNLVVDLASYQDLLQNKTRGNVCREYMIPEPIYYVLEEGDPTEENPRRPFQRPNSSSSHREPLYYVLRELRSRNATNQLNRLPSSEENEEPVYHVLENPMEAEEKT